jgi:hypothetical protein
VRIARGKLKINVSIIHALEDKKRASKPIGEIAVSVDENDVILDYLYRVAYRKQLFTPGNFSGIQRYANGMVA